MPTESPAKETARTWRKFLAEETFEYLYNLAFLALFLVAFAWYRRLILAAHHIQYTSYWMPLIEAAVLAKVIMIGDVLRVGRRFRDKPLAVSTIYRTVVFSIFVALFFLLEHVVEAMIRGGTPAEGVAAIANQGLDEILGSCVMIFAAFLPFFALKEIERVFGAEKVRGLFFSSRRDGNETTVQNDHS